MKKLFIIGARGFGREVYMTAIESHGFKTEFTVAGFLDDNDHALDGIEGYPPIIDSVESYEPRQQDVFICALGDVKAKQKYCDIILKKRGEFFSLIHNSVSVLPSSKIGKGCIIMKSVSLSSNVQIGDFVSIMTQSVIGHDVKIGTGSHVGPFSFMGGKSTAEENVQLYVRSTILPKIKIGKNSVVGAGSVVLKDIEEETTVFGNPARMIQNRKPKID